MIRFIAALPMYDWPETRAETDAEWARIRSLLLLSGIDAPERLARRNADLPPVPGGIRGRDGAVIAPDPATLPPDGFDLPTLWRHPRLLLGQACWGPLELGLAEHVRVIGQPDYSAFEGGEGMLYSSAVLMRRDLPSPLRGGSLRVAERGGGGEGRAFFSTTPTPALCADPPLKVEGGAPSDGRPVLPLGLLAGGRLAYNSAESMSGLIALRRDLEAMGSGLGIFSEMIETGGHRASIVAVVEGRADVCAVDCRSWAMAQRFESRAAALRVVGWTARRRGLPFIAGRDISDAVAETMRSVLRLRASPPGL